MDFTPMVQALMQRFPQAQQWMAAHPNFNLGNGQGLLNRPHPFAGGSGFAAHPQSSGHPGAGFDYLPGGAAAPRPMGPPGGYNTGIVPPGMGQPAPMPMPGMKPPMPGMSHMGPGSGLAPPAKPSLSPVLGMRPTAPRPRY